MRYNAIQRAAHAEAQKVDINDLPHDIPVNMMQPLLTKQQVGVGEEVENCEVSHFHKCVKGLARYPRQHDAGAADKGAGARMYGGRSGVEILGSVNTLARQSLLTGPLCKMLMTT